MEKIRGQKSRATVPLKPETLISSKIWESQAKNSKAKPPAWEAVQASLSHAVSAQVCMHKLFELLIKKLPLCVIIVMAYDYAND